MNDKTKYQIMKNREFLKGYHAGDAGAEQTDQEQKLPGISSLKRKSTEMSSRFRRNLTNWESPATSGI